MARRHHYIPRVLLKRFASRLLEGDDKHLIWQLSIDRLEIEISTKDAAVSKGFYGEDEQLERNFGSFEGELGSALTAIEAGEEPAKLADILRRCLWIQALRTKAFRDQIQRTFRKIFSVFADEASNVDLKARLTKEVVDRFDELAESEISGFSLQQQVISRAMLRVPTFRKLALDAMVQKMTVTDIQAMFSSVIHAIGDTGLIKETLDSSLKRGLSELLAADEPPQNFNPVFWKIHSYEAHSLILGDACVFGMNQQGEIAALHRFSGDWIHVFMPLSHSTLLQASRSDANVTMEPMTVNRASAMLAIASIFSSRVSEDTRQLRELIGTANPFMSPEEISETVRRGCKRPVGYAALAWS